MDYKEKYEQALERMKSWVKGEHPECFSEAQKAAEFIFPELKESEDEKNEKVRIDLIKAFNTIGKLKWGGLNVQDVLTWLEKQGEPKDKGEISDGYHTFNELYRYRMLYNAAFFNLLPKEFVHKSKRHHDGEKCFGGGWFIVMANLPTGQISNHYELKDWDLFQIPERDVADEWDGHTPQEAADRLYEYLLEKRGEKKPTNKIEPKFNFKVGQWIVATGKCVYLITKIDEFTVTLVDVMGNEYEFSTDSLNDATLWTINDAKDGDVLVDEDNNIGLYPGEKDDLYWHSCIYLGCDGYLHGINIGAYHKHKNTKPATEEQRAMLFQRMKEEGYKWDAEKKRIKTIEQKPADKIEPKFKVGNWYQCIKDFFGKGVTFDKNTAYYCTKEGCLLDGCHIAIVKDLYDNFKLWTIADAKEGDVLAVNDEVFIYAHKKYSSVDAHCFVDSAGGFYLDGEFGYTEKGNSIHPATKEQRDTLFAKMKEAGYEWDADKKELKKVEDEGVRKALISILKNDFEKDTTIFGISVEQIIAWLEKQGKQQGKSALEAWKEMRLEVYQQASGNRHEPNYSDDTTKMFSLNDIDEIFEKISEQKLANKVEPKFKVGDWIACKDLNTARIINIDGDKYEVEFIDGSKGFPHIEWVDRNLHLWTIQEAKNGDVLANKHNILILKELDYDWSSNGTPNAVKAYCGIKPNGNFEIGKDNWSFCGTLYIHPATKEQRDTLFAKMADAGYKWNSEKKELRKVETKTLDADDVLSSLGNNQVQDILEDMGMLDDNGQCPHTAEEIFKAGMEHAFNLNREIASSIKVK